MKAIENVLTFGGGMIVLLALFTLLRFVWLFLRGLFNRRRKFPAHELVGNPLAVVTLVHGTFARGAPWTQPGSALSRAVCEHFGGRVQLRRFDWSGRNSFRARARGAEALAADAREIAARYIGVPHYVIAHSHGGNVAIEAAIECRDKEIDGVVCLATPVLTAKRRRFSPLVRIAVGFGFWLLLLLPVLNLESDETSTSEGVAMVVCAGIAWLWFRFAQKIALRVCATRPHKLLDPRRVAFIRSPFDEASGIIGLANVMSWLIGRLTDGPFAVFDHLDRLPSWRARLVLALKLAGIAGLVLLVAGICTVVEPLAGALKTEGDFSTVFFGLVFIVAAICAGVAAMALILPLLHKARESWWWMFLLWSPFFLTMMFAGMMFVPAILLVSFAHALTVGAELFICSVFVEVTAEPCPAGNWTVYQLKPPPRGGLRHSSVYESGNGLAALRTALGGLMDADSVTLMADEPAALAAPPAAVDLAAKLPAG